MAYFETPKSLLDAYSSGFIGSIADPDGTKELLKSLPMPFFGDSGQGLIGSGKGKLSTLYKLIQKLDPKFGESEKQEQGDCVAHSTRNAIDGSRASDILVNGAKFDFVIRGAIEGIYGSRGHTGEGMTCGGSVRYVTNKGGVLLRKKYGNIDLTQYNAKLSGGWGRTGTPRELNEEGKKNQVKTASLIENVDQARDALFNGYGITLCSMVGFSNKRDQNGISQRQGQWAHAMAWVGCDDTREIMNETLFLVQNSWGIWNGGPKRHDQPNGSFWIRESVARDMIQSGEGFALSNVVGFPPKDINWTINSMFN